LACQELHEFKKPVRGFIPDRG